MENTKMSSIKLQLDTLNKERNTKMSSLKLQLDALNKERKENGPWSIQEQKLKTKLMKSLSGTTYHIDFNLHQDTYCIVNHYGAAVIL